MKSVYVRVLNGTSYISSVYDDDDDDDGKEEEGVGNQSVRVRKK